MSRDGEDPQALTLTWMRGKLEALQELLADLGVAPATVIEIVRRAVNEMLAENAAELLAAELALVGPEGVVQCSACRADIVWIRTVKGRKSPCNARRLSVTTPEGKTVTGYESHYSTCPKAGEFRRGAYRR
jgi:hypothetical protein